MSSNATFEQIAGVLRTRERFIVMSHYRPDGDAIGCTLAMALCLRQLGKNVTAWNQDGVPDKYRFLAGSEIITKPPAVPQEFDAAIVLDTATQDRIGTCAAAIAHAGTWVNIDHHISNPRYGDLAHIDADSPATGAVLFELFRAAELPLTYAMADALYVAISTDTGSFQYPSTTARTYEIAAELTRLGVNIGEINRLTYQAQPRRIIELLRALLNTLRFSSADRVASWELAHSTWVELGLQGGDTEDLIDHIRSLDGVVIAAFLQEQKDGQVRMSLRSKDARHDCSAICAQFGGGGHKAAAGATLPGPLAAARETALAAIDRELSKA